MENPFKKIIQEKELPDKIKGKVMDDVNLIRLSLDLSELFFVSIPEVALDFLDTEKKQTEGKEEGTSTSQNTDTTE